MTNCWQQRIAWCRLLVLESWRLQLHTLGFHIRLRIVRNVYSATDTHDFEKGFHRSHERSHGLVQRAPMDSGSRSLISQYKKVPKNKKYSEMVRNKKSNKPCRVELLAIIALLIADIELHLPQLTADLLLLIGSNQPPFHH